MPYAFRELLRLLGDPIRRERNSRGAISIRRSDGLTQKTRARRYVQLDPDLIWACGCRAHIAHGGDYGLNRCEEHEAQQLGLLEP